MKKTLIGFLGLVSLLGGCAMEAGDNAEELTGETAQEVNKGWTDGGFAATTVGMAISGSNTYQWRTDGNVCRGNWSAPCSGDVYPYSAPAAFTAISGVGIAKNTSHVYAWYSDSTVSQGISDNLTAYNGQLSFTRPSKPGGGTFAMSDLIEVDNSDNGEWYYYWKSGSTVYRTTGTSRVASHYSGAQQVTIRQSGPSSIVGIAFGTGSPASVYTFYTGGTVNVSTNSLVLSQL